MNDRRRHPTHPRDRCLISEVRFDDFAEGMIQYGMLKRKPDNASADFLRGREEARQTAISELLAQDEIR